MGPIIDRIKAKNFSLDSTTCFFDIKSKFRSKSTFPLCWLLGRLAGWKLRIKPARALTGAQLGNIFRGKN